MEKSLKQEIKNYKEFYKEDSFVKNLYHTIVKHPNIVIKKAIIYSKKYRYYKIHNTGILNKLKMIYYGRKNNKYATKYNIEIYGEFGENLKIYHNNIVINNNAKLGDGVILHGNNCIGNNGITEKCPEIGDNVDIGFGSVIIGDIKIANNIKIGANAVVTKSFLEEGCIIAGVPAKKIK